MKRAVILSLILSSASFAFAATPKKLSQFLPEGERLVYGRLVEAYRRGKLQDVARQRQLLERHYPRSVHLDNAYYLNGMMEFQNGRYGEAVKLFDVVKTRFAKSNKRSSAMFAMGVTYDRLGLRPLATKVWDSVMNEYPGSVESQRAWMHLQADKVKTRKR